VPLKPILIAFKSPFITHKLKLLKTVRVVHRVKPQWMIYS